MEFSDLRELFFLNERASYETDQPYLMGSNLLELGYVRFKPVAWDSRTRAYSITASGKALIAALVGHANALSLPMIRSTDDGA